MLTTNNTMHTIPYSKFKHGQRVTCEMGEVKIDDAKISIDSDGTVYICQNISSLYSAQNKLGYKKSYRILYKNMNFDWNDYVSNLKFLPHTLDDLKEGDWIVDEGGVEVKVLGVFGKIIFISLYDDFEKVDSKLYTLYELKEYGYTLKQDIEEPEEGKLDLRSPEAEKMREEARSKRWEHIPKEGDNLYIHTFKENVDKIYYSQAISRNEILAQWNIGNYHKSYEDMEAWGDKYARYFFTE